MSFKENYIKMRNEGKYDLNVFWNHYRESGGKIKNAQEFANAFMYEEVDMDYGHKMRTNRNRDAIMEGIESKLGLTSLYGVNGEFIKIVN
jgi:hypothetical protein